MIGYVHSDGGRRDAGWKLESKTDGVVCAIADVLNEHYKKWYMIVGMYNQRRGLTIGASPLDHDVPVILEAANLVNVTMPRNGWLTLTEAYETFGDCIVFTGRKLVPYAIRDGSIYAKSAKALKYRTWSVTANQLTEVERKTRQIWVKKERKP